MLLFSTNCPVQSYALHYDYKGKVSLVCDSRSQGPRFVSHCGHFGVPNLVDQMSGGVQNCLRASLFFVMVSYTATDPLILLRP